LTQKREKESWEAELLVTSGGAPKPLLANVITALKQSPGWFRCLAYDVFAHRVMIVADPPINSRELNWQPRAWTSDDDVLATNWLHHRGIGVNVATAAQAVENVAKEQEFHPVADYLNNLQHDGVTRARTWLSVYLGTELSPYLMAVGQAMLIAAVARIYEPGCKVDTVPILEGAQGARKSTAVKAMFDPWFTDELADLGSKDACLQTQGVWGVEVSELDAMTRGEVSRIKAFISRTTDRFRPPYGHRVIETARECVFWGTTNSDSYLKDETGGRRFWPIKVGKIDIDGLIGVRDMLWAEAKALYEKNTPWWLAKDDVLKQAEDQQRGRYIGDPWERHISDYVESSVDGEISIDVILRNALDLPISHCGQVEMNRAARVLSSLGLVRTQVRIGDKRVWKYRKPVTSPHDFRGDRPGTSSKPVTPDRPVTPERPAAQTQSQQSPLSPVEEEFS
jgi:predicted P-loop ATPase